MVQVSDSISDLRKEDMMTGFQMEVALQAGCIHLL